MVGGSLIIRLDSKRFSALGKVDDLVGDSMFPLDLDEWDFGVADH